MKVIGIIFLQLLLGNVLLAQADSCAPTLSQIYNFQVGDVFQYVENKFFTREYPLLDTDLIIKYTVVAKFTRNDSLIYIRKGIRKEHAYRAECSFNSLYGDIECTYKDLGYTDTTFQDTLTIIDSIGNALNSCNGDTVKIPYSHCGQGYYNCAITTGIDTTDGLPTKFLEFVMLNDSDCITLMADNSEYKENLGIINLDEEYIDYFITDYHLHLEGYVKSGDTTGVITSDKDLLSGIISPSLDENSIKIYPNPDVDERDLTIKNVPANSVVQVISMDGRIYRSISYNNEKIWVADLPKGIYLIKVISKNKIQIGKWIKY